MKLFTQNKPINHAVIVTDDGSYFILIKHLFSGFSTYENYTLYGYDPKSELVNTKPISKIQMYKIKKAGAPYVFSSMALLTWAIARNKIKLDANIKIDNAALNSLLIGWLNEFNTSFLDILTTLAP